MKEIAIRFSGGKDSMLATLRVAPEFDRVHLLTFGHQMIADLDKPAHNVTKLEQALGTPGKFVHEVFDITPIIRYFYEGKGYLSDVRKYGTLARAGTCTACDFAMFVRTILYCLEHDIHFACDGGNRSEFSGFLDEWGLDSIKDFAASHGVEWVFPVYDDPRCDVSLLKEGLEAPEPTLMYGQQACCRGVGTFSNVHLRTYFLPRHGVEKYKELTLAWLAERYALADELIRRELNGDGTKAREDRPPDPAAGSHSRLRVLG
ncbi:MAG: hypothetical protein QOF89_462 [Acidobacteriota bacterium]|jgi:hypothetical protein|nr:hypothetical protein [Acidobacteriota bacterium]